MLAETIDRLFLERDQTNTKIRALDEKVKNGSDYFEREIARKASKETDAILKSIDTTLPILLAMAGRKDEVRILFPNAFLIDENGKPGPVVGMPAYSGGQVDTILDLAKPFPDVYFGRGQNGQILAGLKPLENGEVLLFAEQLRYHDIFIYIGPVAEIQELAHCYRFSWMDLPNWPRSEDPSRGREYLLRVDGPADNPNYNPRYIARNITTYMSEVVPGSVADGFIKIRDDGSERRVKALVKPQIFTENWWLDAKHPGDDVDWRTAALDVTAWRRS